MSTSRKQRKAIVFWAKLLNGQKQKKPSQPRLKCPQCFETFKTKEGRTSHLFHKHTLDGRRRAPKKEISKKKKKLTRKNIRQRISAAKKPRKSYSLEEKIKFVQKYDDLLDPEEFERETGVRQKRISD